MYRLLKLLVVLALMAAPWPAGAQDIRNQYYLRHFPQ
jgi:hypothetical protein